MKKAVLIIVCLVMSFTLMLPMKVSAASADANLSGPGTVRVGDTITLTFNISGSGILGASGSLSYDSSQLTLTGTSQEVASPWAVEFSGSNFVAYDNDLSSPINSSTALFTATFKVNSGLRAGEAVKVSCTGVTASDGSADVNVGTVTYSAVIAAPLSTDNTLKSLTVSNAAISPAFSAGTTSYTASVPYEVSRLEVSATAKDSKAKVSINSPALIPNGTTNVTITVTAENGSRKTYTISVKRAQDPNYLPSSNNDLSDITVDGFLLSPVFSAENTEYVVWLPYEIESVTIGGTTADSKASVEVVGGDSLIAGADNEIQIVCTAEDGTQKRYTVIAKRAAAHGEEATEATEPTEPEPTQTQPETTAPSEPEQTVLDKENEGIPMWLLIAACVVCLAAGAGVGILADKKFRK